MRTAFIIAPSAGQDRLLDDAERNTIERIPFLGDLPILGNLFKTKGRAKSKAELLVFVTPRVLRVAPRSY